MNYYYAEKDQNLFTLGMLFPFTYLIISIGFDCIKYIKIAIFGKLGEKG